jgi:excisionase family DNA binding protein
MTLLVLEVDPVLARHLARAVEHYRDALARHGYPRPAGLLDLQAAAERAARTAIPGDSRQDGTPPVDSSADALYGGRRDLLTQRRAAAMVGVSERTIRSWLDRGELLSVRVAGRRRIRAADLERFTRGADA